MSNAIQLIPEFEDAVNAAREAESQRAKVLFGESTELTNVRKTELQTPSEITKKYREFDKVVAKLVDEIVGVETGGEPKAITDLQSVVFQADYVARQHRANVLRHSSRARRKVHAGARRESHGIDGGYLTRHVHGVATAFVQASKI
jgi:hypothetical protein